MAQVFPDISRTFHEFLLLPNYTSKACVLSAVDFKTPLKSYLPDKKRCPFVLNIPVISASMQSVSGHKLAIALAQQGGLSFIPCSQSITKQCMEVRKVKEFKAGFVQSQINLTPNHTYADALSKFHQVGHKTIVITEDGSAKGKFLGLLKLSDFHPDYTAQETLLKQLYTPLEECRPANIQDSLTDIHQNIWKNKRSCLPILDNNGHLHALVFKKDYISARELPNQLIDHKSRLCVGAAINTRDYKDRVPALIEAGVDVCCIDSSDGFSFWQEKTLHYVKSVYPEMIIGAGNVIDREGFRFLVSQKADFVKIGVGGGAICITREQKGIGRGQASAIIDITAERNLYLKETGIYIPLCSDGGVVVDNHISIALAMGADSVMMGRYFARFDESPGRKMTFNGKMVKEYWGEGSERARNWQRYDSGDNDSLVFEEGVDSFVPYAGTLQGNITKMIFKLSHTFCHCGALSIQELHKKARLTVVSEHSLREGSAHDVTIVPHG